MLFILGQPGNIKNKARFRALFFITDYLVEAAALKDPGAADCRL
jgi:hypothetical protein